MAEYLLIEARLPKQAGLLELSARLMAARPDWDIEVAEDGLSYVIPLIHGLVDEDLSALEEACRQAERNRDGLEVELWVRRVESVPSPAPPAAAGPWRIMAATEEAAAEGGTGRILMPPELRYSRRLWAGEALLLEALSAHFLPPPGAPETKGRPFLALEARLPAAPVAALMAGAENATLLADEETCRAAELLGRINRQPEIRALSDPFKTLARKRADWAGHFGLIAVHLSPYLAARRLKTLASWLAPEGVMIISGFASGPQTAHLLRAAARAGLNLTGSVTEGDWAAMTLELVPQREELPPLTGSVVPDLVEPPAPPPEEFMEIPDEDEDVTDEESLMVADDDVEEDE